MPKDKHDHCKHCGACDSHDRCDHCGHCRKCGVYVAPYWPYWPFVAAPWPIPAPYLYPTTPNWIISTTTPPNATYTYQSGDRPAGAGLSYMGATSGLMGATSGNLSIDARAASTLLAAGFAGFGAS